jgi:AcrR family transcriptional regulator
MTTVLSNRLTQEERTALSDQRMMDAAIALLVESGIVGTTFAAIGARAGYSRGLVTHRFGSKSGLLAQVHDTVAAEWILRVKLAVDDRNGVAALECVVDALYSFIEERPDNIRAMYLLRYASIDPGAEFRANVAKMARAQRRDVQGWIAAGQAAGKIPRTVDSLLAAELFCASVDGLLYRWLVNPKLPVGALHDQLKVDIERILESRP